MNIKNPMNNSETQTIDVSNETIQKLINEEARKLAFCEMWAWRAHNNKNGDLLFAAMAGVYRILYDIEFEDGVKAGMYTASAAWKHDLAEKYQDEANSLKKSGSDQSRVEDLETKSAFHWAQVLDDLTEHYAIVIGSSSFLNKKDTIEMKSLSKRLARWDVERWVQHHLRNEAGIADTMSAIYANLLEIPQDAITPTINPVNEALHVHDKAEATELQISETDRFTIYPDDIRRVITHGRDAAVYNRNDVSELEKKAEGFWGDVEQLLIEHFKQLLLVKYQYHVELLEEKIGKSLS